MNVKYRKILKKSFVKCIKGAFFWKSLIHKHIEIKNTAVILLPDKDDEISYIALLYLDKFLDSSGRDNAVILTSDEKIAKVYKFFSQRVESVILVSDEKIELLMKYYSLYNFDDRLIVASLDKPDGRNGRKMIGLKGMTIEDIFVIGVYKLYPFKKLPRIRINQTTDK